MCYNAEFGRSSSNSIVIERGEPPARGVWESAVGSFCRIRDRTPAANVFTTLTPENTSLTTDSVTLHDIVHWRMICTGRANKKYPPYNLLLITH